MGQWAVMDTAAKRFSIIGFSIGRGVTIPLPTGTVDQADRQWFLWNYVGILWSEGSIDPGPLWLLGNDRARTVARAAAARSSNARIGFVPVETVGPLYIWKNTHGTASTKIIAVWLAKQR